MRKPIRVTIASEALAARLDAVCSRIGIPASTLCLIALDAYLPVLADPPPPRKAVAPKKKKPLPAFVPPTTAEVQARFEAKGLPDADLHAANFVEHFEDRGWRTGSGSGRPMRSWTRAVDKWERTRRIRARETDRKTGRNAPLPEVDLSGADWST